MLDLAAVQRIATSNVAADQRLVVDGNKVVSSKGTLSGLTATFSPVSQSAQNLQLLGELDHALSQRYGAQVTQLAMKSLFGIGLTSGTVDVHKGDIGRLLAALDQHERLHIGLNDPNAIQQKVLHAQGQVQLPHPELRALMAPLLQASLTSILPSIQGIDLGSDNRVLAQMGNQLASIVDRHLLVALRSWGQTLNPASTDLTAILQALGNAVPAGLQQLALHAPNVMASIQTECQLFETAMGSMARRFTTELPHLNNAFANTWPPNTPAAQGVVGVKVTDSDPHHGGNRVCILTLDNGQRIVYKPRDCRIDAKLTGECDPNGTVANLSVLGFTDRLLARHGVNGASTPKLTYHCAHEQVHGQTERFAFVECLSNGSKSDCSIGDATARQYYLDLGRSAAALMLFGTRDLHQRNVMTSEGRPYFTDVEISLDQSMLDIVTTDLGQAPPNNGTPPLPQFFSRSQFVGALTHRDEVERCDPILLQVGQLVTGIGTQEKMVTDSFVHVKGVGGNDKVALHKRYAQEFARGFQEVLLAYKAETGRIGNEIPTLLASFNGVHVRYHPIATGEHLATLQNIKGTVNLTTLTTPTKLTALQQQAQGLVNRSINNGSTLPLRDIETAIVNDWQQGDVPYFTRDVSTRELMHNGHTPVTVNPQNGAPHTQFFPQTPLQTLTATFTALANTPLNNLMGIGQGVEGFLRNLDISPLSQEVGEEFAEFYKEQKL